MSQRGKVVFITGAASGIGEALAVALAAQGARLVLADIDDARLQALAARLGSGGEVEAHVLDVTDADAFAARVADLVARLGRLDVIFNNAGTAVSGDARDLDVARWKRIVDVNLMGVIHGTDAAFRVMAAQRGGGHIVNIASLAGLTAFPTNAPYCATKHAVVGMSLALRIEGEDLGVRVSVVCPGFVETNIFTASEAVNVPQEQLIGNIPLPKVSATEAAERILEGVARNRAVIIFPAYARIMWWLNRLSPWFGVPLGRRLVRDFRKLRRVP